MTDNFPLVIPFCRYEEWEVIVGHPSPEKA